jgi:hypothetical protein
MDRCDKCGFVYDLDLATGAPDRIVALAARIATIVVVCEISAVRVRPQPHTWSVLEYACHVRDVLLVQRERVLLALRVDQPDVVPMGRTNASRPTGTTTNARSTSPATETRP